MEKVNIFEAHSIPTIKIGSGILIAIEHCDDAIKAIYDSKYHFLGYEGFKVFPDGKRQPNLSFSASFSFERQPTIDEVLNGIDLETSEITHYEFVFG